MIMQAEKIFEKARAARVAVLGWRYADAGFVLASQTSGVAAVCICALTFPPQRDPGPGARPALLLCCRSRFDAAVGAISVCSAESSASP